MFKFKFTKLAVLLATLAFSFSAVSAEKSKVENSKDATVVLSGSDIITPSIQKVLLDAVKLNNNSLELNMRGTYPVLKPNADFDIAIVAVPKGKKIPEGLIAIPFAYKAAIVVVNSSNPLDEISLDNLARIYSRSALGEYDSWEQVGVRHSGFRGITALCVGHSADVVAELLKYSCFDGGEFSANVNLTKTSADATANVRATNSAIAVVGNLEYSSATKVLSVSDTKRSAGRYAFPPNQDTLFNGDYPMALNFYIVYHKKNAQKVKNIASILLSDAVAKALEKGGFFSVPKNSRKKSLFDLTLGGK